MGSSPAQGNKPILSDDFVEKEKKKESLQFVYKGILFQSRKTCISIIKNLLRGLEAEIFSNEEIIGPLESSRRYISLSSSVNNLLRS